MSETKYTKEDLKTMQSWSLARKIQVTQTRIIEWYLRYKGQVYVSFSGGKDSTVLLDLARRINPDIEAVFVDTGLEYPEIKTFIKSFDNVTIIRPEMNFRKVIEKYGYPVISKAVAHSVSVARRNPNGAVYKNLFNPEKRGPYAMYKYEDLLNAPFDVSDKCCNVIKKNLHTLTASRVVKRLLLAQWRVRARCVKPNGQNTDVMPLTLNTPHRNPSLFGQNKIYYNI